jgi:translation initiation factor 2 subunit 2
VPIDIHDYETLLERARKQLPEVVFEKKRFEMPQLEIFIEGRRTIVQNWSEILSRLNRAGKHVIRYMNRELATAGTEGGGRVIFAGVFSKKILESVLEKYVETYVKCRECEKPDTKLEKEGRLTFLQCEACGARHSVPPI